MRIIMRLITRRNHKTLQKGSLPLTKIKILTALIAVLILISIRSVFIYTYFTVSVRITPETKTIAELQYKTSETKEILTQKKQSDAKGRLFFFLPEQQLLWLELNLEKNFQTSSVFITGDKKITSYQEHNFTFSPPLNGRLKIDWYNAIVLFLLLWYLLYFPFCSQKDTKIQTLPTSSQKFMNIEFLRIVFTLFVVTCHIQIPLKVWSNTRYAVEFFFILSGFFLTLFFNPDKTTFSFIKQKICRFWPLLVFGALINCLFVRHINGSKLLSDIFLLSNVLYKDTGYNGPAWYICVLFWVSLFYFSLFKTQKKSNINLIVGLCLFGSLSVLSDASFLGGKIRIFRGIAGIGTGYYVALAYQQLSALPIRKSCFFSIAEGSLLLYCFLSMFYSKIFPDNPIFIMIAFAFLILLFVLKIGCVSRFFEKPIFVKLSKYCLSIYLTHETLTQPIMAMLLEKYADFMKAYFGLTWFIFISAACLLGIAAHYLIEKPGQKMISNGLNYLINQQNKE